MCNNVDVSVSLHLCPVGNKLYSERQYHQCQLSGDDSKTGCGDDVGIDSSFFDIVCFCWSKYC